MTAQLARRFLMQFAECQEVALIRTEFTHEVYAPSGRVTVRGKHQTAIPDAKTFQWSPAVRALTGYLVRCAAWSRRELQEHSNTDAPCNIKQSALANYPRLEGRRHSPATSVNDALNAKVKWMGDMFGSNSEDTFHLAYLLWRDNPPARPREPVSLRLNEKRLCPCRLQVMVDRDQVNDPQRLDRLAEAIERTWLSNDRSGIELTLRGVPNEFIEGGGLERLRRFLAENGVPDVEVVRVESGSVKLTLSLPEDHAERLSWLAASGALEQFGLLSCKYVPLEHEVLATNPCLEAYHSYLLQRARFLLGDPRAPVELDAEELASETLRSAYGTAETAFSDDVTRAEQLARLEKIQDRMLVDSLEKSSIGQRPAQQETDPPTADYVPVGDEVLDQKIAGYEILGELGRGGMGVVYKARESSLNRLVALKMIKDDFPDEQARERFRREAQAVARLEHPHIVRVYQFEEPPAGRPYFVMELVEGSDLKKRLNARPLPPREAATLVEVLAQAIHHAHQRDIVHRDLKPANVLLAEDGTPKVTDFGLAKNLAEAGPTQTVVIMGTPEYMAPEQASGKIQEVGPAADVYALGVILYECLTGRPPFKGATPLETLQQVREEPPAPPRLLNPNIPRDLETVCLECLKKDRAQRYASAAELADDLQRFLDGKPVQRRRPRWWQPHLGLRREVLDTLSWSNLCFGGAGLALCTHLAIFCILQAGWSTSLFVPCVAINVLLCVLNTWLCFGRRRQPLTDDEWNIAILSWAFGLGGYALFAFAYPFDRESILALYPPLALLYCMLNVVIARLYWGPHYWKALFYFLLAVAMRWKPEWAPLLFAVLNSAESIASGLILRWHRQD